MIESITTPGYSDETKPPQTSLSGNVIRGGRIFQGKMKQNEPYGQFSVRWTRKKYLGYKKMQGRQKIDSTIFLER